MKEIKGHTSLLNWLPWWFFPINHHFSHSQGLVKFHCRWEIIHAAEDDVDDEADDNPEVKERVCDDGMEPVFEPTPTATAVPRQDALGSGEAAPRTRRWHAVKQRRTICHDFLHLQKQTEHLGSHLQPKRTPLCTSFAGLLWLLAFLAVVMVTFWLCRLCEYWQRGLCVHCLNTRSNIRDESKSSTNKMPSNCRL